MSFLNLYYSDGFRNLKARVFKAEQESAELKIQLKDAIEQTALQQEWLIALEERIYNLEVKNREG
jgi:hypothetical protein